MGALQDRFEPQSDLLIPKDDLDEDPEEESEDRVMAKGRDLTKEERRH